MTPFDKRLKAAVQEPRESDVEKSTSLDDPAMVGSSIFSCEGVMQGEPVAHSPPVNGLGEAVDSVSKTTSGPRESPDAANPGEGLESSSDLHRAPFLIELFCGTAGVCAKFRTLGGRALGIDHHLKRTKLKSAAVKLDLTQQWVQDLISREIFVWES